MFPPRTTYEFPLPESPHREIHVPDEGWSLIVWRLSMEVVGRLRRCVVSIIGVCGQRHSIWAETWIWRMQWRSQGWFLGRHCSTFLCRTWSSKSDILWTKPHRCKSLADLGRWPSEEGSKREDANLSSSLFDPSSLGHTTVPHSFLAKELTNGLRNPPSSDDSSPTQPHQDPPLNVSSSPNSQKICLTALLYPKANFQLLIYPAFPGRGALNRIYLWGLF